MSTEESFREIKPERVEFSTEVLPRTYSNLSHPASVHRIALINDSIPVITNAPHQEDSRLDGPPEFREAFVALGVGAAVAVAAGPMFCLPTALSGSPKYQVPMSVSPPESSSIATFGPRNSLEVFARKAPK